MKLYNFINYIEDLTIAEVREVLGTSKVPYYLDKEIDYSKMKQREDEFFSEEIKKAEELISKLSGFKNPVLVVDRSYSNYFGWETKELYLTEDYEGIENLITEPHEGSCRYIIQRPTPEVIMQEYMDQTPYVQEEWDYIKVPDSYEIRENLTKYIHTYSSAKAEEVMNK